MSTYLHIAHGGAGLLVDIHHVVEVADSAAHQDSGGRRPWRGSQLPAVSLAARLGGNARARQQVILRHHAHGEAQLALDVEQVIGLVEVEERDLQSIGAIDQRLACVIDAACTSADGRCLLRLRAPFTWATDGLPTEGEHPP